MKFMKMNYLLKKINSISQTTFGWFFSDLKFKAWVLYITCMSIHNLYVNLYVNLQWFEIEVDREWWSKK